MKTKKLLIFPAIGVAALAAAFLYMGNGDVADMFRGGNPASLPTPTVNPAADFVLYDVPFTPQAPFGEWDDPRQQDGCEEAAALMAMRWVQARSLTLSEARQVILDAASFQLEKYGEFRDASAKDTVARIFNDYFGYYNVKLKTDIDADDIKEELKKGNIVLVHANGQLLGNPYFSGNGPEYHALVIKGFDERRGEFITNDPGTKRGESYRYKYKVLENAIADYPTGFHRPRLEISKVMIVVSK